MDPITVIDTIIDTMCVTVNENTATNIYDFGEFLVSVIMIVAILMILFGNPFRRREE